MSTIDKSKLRQELIEQIARAKANKAQNSEDETTVQFDWDELIEINESMLADLDGMIAEEKLT